MVKITNGLITCEVTTGAYKSIYKHQGFRLVDEQSANDTNAGGSTPPNDPPADPFADLVEKPLSQWNKNEVKKFADAKGIDLTGTKNVNEAKDRIKAYLDNAGGSDDEPEGETSAEE